MSVIRVIFTVDDRRLGEFIRSTYAVVPERAEIELIGAGRVMPDTPAETAKPVALPKKKKTNYPPRYKNGHKPSIPAQGVVDTDALLEEARKKAGEKKLFSLRGFEELVMEKGVSDKAAYYHVMKLIKQKKIGRTPQKGIYRIFAA